jgi:hypothetical protein
LVLLVALLAVGAVAIAASGDSGDEETPVGTTTTTPSDSTTVKPGQTSTPEPEEEPSPGSSIGAGVVAIKIDNSRAARPQWGLSEATLLLEHFVEGPISRFTAVFPSDASGLAGPVRSLRPVDADLLPVFANSVVSSGGRPFVVQDVEASGIQTFLPVVSSMFPSVGNADPFDTFVDLGILANALDAGSGSPPGLPAGELPSPTAAAEELVLPFEGAVVRYDPEQGYLHERAGEPLLVLDASGSNPSQLSHDTLVVISAAERSAGYTDVNDVPVVTYDVIGGGDLLVLHAGEVIVGTWRRDSQADGFELLDATGNSFGLPEGIVYLAIVPSGSQVSYR